MMVALNLKAMSDVQVRIANNIIPIEADTFTTNLGKGETMVRRLQAGSKNRVTVSAKSLESAKSKGSFDVPTTPELVLLINSLKDTGPHAMTVTDASGFIMIFEGMEITNDPEFGTGAEGKATVEWEASPVQLVPVQGSLLASLG